MKYILPALLQGIECKLMTCFFFTWYIRAFTYVCIIRPTSLSDKCFIERQISVQNLNDLDLPQIITFFKDSVTGF